MPLLAVQDLTVVFQRKGEEAFTAVDEVSFDVEPGQTVGLVGESGCGKSVTSLAIMGLLPSRGARVSGSVRFEGTELLELSDRQMRDRRGRDLGMVFQDPLSSLNPVVPIGIQVTEVLERHRGMPRKRAMREAEDLLRRVGIPDPRRRLTEYPHQLSGGMRQRALIVITHDLGVIAGLCDEVNVLYAGRVVERGPRHQLFAAPRHPYTYGLLSSIPRLDAPRGQRLVPIRGSITDNIPWSTGCAFAPRCPRRVDACVEVTPVLDDHEGRLLRCHNPVPVTEEAAVPS